MRLTAFSVAAELAEHSQHGLGEDGGAVPKAPQEPVRVVLMPDGGFAVAVKVRSLPQLVSAPEAGV